MTTSQMTSENSNGSKCPYCNDTGWELYNDKYGKPTAKECRCGKLKADIMKSRLRFASIPESFKDMRFNTFNLMAYQKKESQYCARKACESIKYWIDNLSEMKDRGMGLYLYSFTKGSGKTRMAACIANELMYEKNMQVKFCTTIQILNEIKAIWNNDNDEYLSENRFLEYLSTTDVLIIDDFGIESVKDWISERFYHIINGRYVENKITIYTSNVGIDKLKYDDRIKNRIKERCFQIPFPEESVREHIAMQNKREILSPNDRKDG